MIKIEYASEKDLVEVARIEKELFSQPWSNQAFKESLSLEHVLFLVAKSEEELVGYCVLYQALDEGEITNVGVKNSAQNTGMGNLLMEALKEKAQQNHVKTLFLEVRISNQPAIHLYEKNGFKTIGVRKNFYEEPLEDAYVMKCEL